ncbi:MAG: preprotein translocase subunit SecE [Dehalococcoidia bacterium]|nr:preprotein translocase subunit SecE [Dehalococcoidia bacterium]
MAQSETKKKSNFFGDIYAELKKVTWLSWSEALRLTALVLGISIVVGLVLGGIDYGFSALINKVFIGG